LGEKKRRKTLAALKESDVGVLVVDVSRQQQQQQGQQLNLDQLRQSLHWEVQLLKDAAHYQVRGWLVVQAGRWSAIVTAFVT
jgi:hypothetical protein